MCRFQIDRESAWRAWETRPSDRGEAMAVLSMIVDREVARLKSLEAVRAASYDEELGEAADLASFDPSPEGEKIRRHLASLHRQLMKTLDTLAKGRQQAMKLQLDAARLRKMTNEANLAAAAVGSEDTRVAGVDERQRGAPGNEKLGDLRSAESAGATTSGTPRW